MPQYEYLGSVGSGSLTDLTGSANVVLGPGAGVGAAIVAVTATNGGGSVTFTAGTAPGTGILFTVTFSEALVGVFGGFFNGAGAGGANAADRDLSIQLRPLDVSGTQLRAQFDNSGPSLTPGDNYTIVFAFTH